MSTTAVQIPPQAADQAWDAIDHRLDDLDWLPALVAQYCDRVIDATVVLALASVPLYFNLEIDSVFEPGKAILVLSWAVVLIAALGLRTLVVLVARMPADYSAEPGELPQPPAWQWHTGLSQHVLVLVLVAYVATQAVASVLSVAPGISWLGQTGQLRGTLLTLGLAAIAVTVAWHYRHASAVRVDRLLGTMLVAAIPVCLVALAPHLTATAMQWPEALVSRAPSTLGRSAALLTYIVFLAPIATARLLETVGAWWRRSSAGPSQLHLWSGIFSGLILVLLANGLLGGFLYGTRGEVVRWWAALPVVGTVALLCAWVARINAGLATRTAGLLAVLVLLAATTVVTLGYGPALGIAGLLAGMLLLCGLRSRRPRTALTLMMLVLLVGSALVVLNLPWPARGGLDSWLPTASWLRPLTPWRQELRHTDWSDRLSPWRIGLDAWWAGPATYEWLSDPVSNWRRAIGWGPNTYRVAYHQLALPTVYPSVGVTPGDDDIRPPHVVLDHLVGSGAIGAGTYVALILAIFVRGLVVLRRTVRPVLATGLLAALTAYLVAGQTGAVPVAAGLYAGVLAGLMTTLDGGRREGAGQPETHAWSQEEVVAIPIGPSVQWLAVSLTVGAVAAGLAAAYLSTQDFSLGLSPQRTLVWGALWMLLGPAVLAVSDLVILWPPEPLPDLGVGQWWWLGPAALSIAVLVVIAVIQLWRPVAAAIYARLGMTSSQTWAVQASLVGRALHLAPYDDRYALLLAETLLNPLRDPHTPTKAAEPEDFDPLALATPQEWLARGRPELRATIEAAIATALAWHPRHAAAHLLQGEFALAIQPQEPGAPLPEAVVIPYRRAIALQPSLLSPRLFLARAALAAGHEQEAEEELAALLRIAPRFAPAQVLLGDLWWRQGRSRLAWETHLHSLELDAAAWYDDRLAERVAGYLDAGWGNDLLAAIQSTSAARPTPALQRLREYVQSAMAARTGTSTVPETGHSDDREAPIVPLPASPPAPAPLGMARGSRAATG